GVADVAALAGDQHHAEVGGAPWGRLAFSRTAAKPGFPRAANTKGLLVRLLVPGAGAHGTPDLSMFLGGVPQALQRPGKHLGRQKIPVPVMQDGGSLPAFEFQEAAV